MNVSLQSLIGKLNDPCRGALEAAAGLCLTRTNYDVDVEHLYMKLVELPDSDFAAILRHFSVDSSRLARDLTRALDRLKTVTREPRRYHHICRGLSRRPG
jgi:type VI secretion system protein VasG